MKPLLCLLFAALLLTGCSSTSVEKRRGERIQAYTSLSPEEKATVDLGQIRVGMTMDAVYIAWGKPSQVLVGETAEGRHTTWIYHGTYLEPYGTWTYPTYVYRGGFYAPHMEPGYYSRSYPRAEVRFEDSLVKEWRSLPKPGY